jgi:DNA polymerase-3 subunit delta
MGQEEVSVADVEAVVGDVSAETLDEAVDAAASGEVKRLPELVERLLSSGTQPFALQGAVLRHFHALLLMRERVERHGESVTRAVEARRPNFRRKAAMEAALGAWTLASLPEALIRIEAAILTGRKEGALAQAVTAKLLTDLAVEAARARLRGGKR